MTDETHDDDIDTEVADDETTEGRDERRAALDDVRANADSLSDGDIVDQRTADTHATKKAEKVRDDEHVKVFVIPGSETKPTATNYDHEPNIDATRQYMMSQGLRPTSPVRFVGAEAFGPGGKSWALTYAVSALPAERFDFNAEVHVIQGEGGAEGEGPDDNAGNGDEAPSMKWTREQIDEHGAKLDPPVDTTGAKDKAEALALLGIKAD